MRVRHDDVLGGDENIADAHWANMHGSYTRTTHGCKDGTATYFSEQILGGDKKKSTYRKFKNCVAQ